MYGLPQAGKIAYDRLVKHLATAGYIPCELTPGLFKHKTRPISFALVVDDFFVKYVGKEHADHLMECLRLLFVVKTDWDATLILGITMEWNYTQGTVDLSMPNYIEQALIKYMAGVKYDTQHSPHQQNTITYGAKVQYTTPHHLMTHPHWTKLV